MGTWESAVPHSSASCTTCHHVVSKITSVVDNKVVEKAIEKTVKSTVCPTFGSMELACDLLVPKLVPEVIDEVVGVLKKDGYSAFCHKAEVHPFEAAALCGLCESVVIKAHDKASSKDFKADVSALAGRLCDAWAAASRPSAWQSLLSACPSPSSSSWTSSPTRRPSAPAPICAIERPPRPFRCGGGAQDSRAETPPAQKKGTKYNPTVSLSPRAPAG